MDKRERLEKTIAGETTDRAPVALWQHFPGDDHRAADLARAVVDFQRAYDWDFVVLHSASTYAVFDYGIRERWEDTTDGLRVVSHHPIQRSLDWTELRTLDPKRGTIARQIECARLLVEALANEPILFTLYSPLDQADMLAGRETLVEHLRTQPDRLRSGLNILTENTLHLIDALRKLPLAGFCLVARYASYAALSEDEYRAFGLVYDRKVLDAMIPRRWLNLLSLDCELPMFRLMTTTPVHAIQWRARETEPDLALGKSLCTGAICGGLSSRSDVYLGAPTTVRDSARDALERANRRRIILSTGSPLRLASPSSNLRAARAAVEPTGV